MDNTRFILVVSLMFVVMMLWQEWQADYGPQPQDTSIDVGNTGAEASGEIPEFAGEAVVQAPIQAPVLTPSPSAAVIENSAGTASVVTVETDMFNVIINEQGAGLEKLELKAFPVSVEEPDRPLILLDKSKDLLFISQGGLLSNRLAPNHAAVFSAENKIYSMGSNEQTLEIRLVWSSGDGIQVVKTFGFQRGSYEVSVNYHIENNSSEPWGGRSYVQLKRNDPGRASAFMINTYTGGVYSTPEERYEKIAFDDIADADLDAESANAWIAMIQHYFVVAVLPEDKEAVYRYYTSALSDGNFAIGAMSPDITIAPGSTADISERMYIGPKYQDDLALIAEGLDLTIDYGVLWFLAKPLFVVLNTLHGFTNNWGWAIILVTMMLKLVFYPLSAAGYRSMANMRRVQPRMVAMKDRYKDDKAKLNQGMMALYKEEKVNPFGGCLPILVQIPVFISLYWVLLESVEMRQASFIFWYNDLSGPDPFFVLPLLMGVSMFIQQKLNPPPMDPIQAKVFSVLPIVFTVFFAFFPSGLVLYWVVNNILSILQQWRITKMIERAGLNKSG
jgi:YidC/Oxa1 family membrane protein insertase